jgi:ketosteroid isomerase-like protein
MPEIVRVTPELSYSRSEFQLENQELDTVEARSMKRSIAAGVILVLGVAIAVAEAAVPRTQQKSMSDEGGRVLALEKAWNLALEEKDAKALDMLLANTLVSVDIDGSVASKSEFLASIKAPDYKPSQVVTEQTSVQVYGNAAVVTGTFRVKGSENGKPYVRRERFTDTWIKINETWQCVASQTTLIPGK